MAFHTPIRDFDVIPAEGQEESTLCTRCGEKNPDPQAECPVEGM